jgi:hypothetical protein
MKAHPMPEPERPRLAPAQRRRIARATMLWGGVALTGTTLVGGLAIWHLVRRGRILRESLGDPRPIKPLESPPAKPS